MDNRREHSGYPGEGRREDVRAFMRAETFGAVVDDPPPPPAIVFKENLLNRSRALILELQAELLSYKKENDHLKSRNADLSEQVQCQHLLLQQYSDLLQGELSEEGGMRSARDSSEGVVECR